MKSQGELQFWQRVARSDSLEDIRSIVAESAELLAMLGIAPPTLAGRPSPGAIGPVTGKRDKQLVEQIVRWAGEHYVFGPDDIRNHWLPILLERMDRQSAEATIQMAIEQTCDPEDYEDDDD